MIVLIPTFDNLYPPLPPYYQVCLTSVMPSRGWSAVTSAGPSSPFLLLLLPPTPPTPPERRGSVAAAVVEAGGDEAAGEFLTV